MIALPPALSGHRIVPVLVIDDAGFAVDAAAALAAGGIGCVEITLRTPAALAAITAIADAGTSLVGVGTVVTPDDLNRAADAGALFVITPGVDREVIDLARERGLDILPGVATATDVLAVLRSGLRAVKLFPADILGGVDLIAALAGPFPDVAFVPSGGVSPANVASYLAHPNVPAVSGSWMAGRQLLASRDVATIERLSREAVALAGAG
ncbi:bifunctional 4-hydroxy-2-oxoglutarate aldolase/2-dehydro-3-deoxy-phosphogluconate aldolase [Pseudolysinimonas yzui]|uniref:2-dehydro-3-deoxy-phosphogluconate aldolase n=1 Tax=Pseudolysinimonas yzui TaxID=2708254 RepID=A0A8J3GSD3_9MICO|nr:bifunctional 4-hydroxy-2-oxoglutarate aldolase/2-dehydro-3-deoxy-phosphogluconate aldolase [Pseudolysinimonas yzui]GHF22821.1 ketohydroxyglutarate aldolase [Pseudolysinimonas yzui]